VPNPDLYRIRAKGDGANLLDSAWVEVAPSLPISNTLLDNLAHWWEFDEANGTRVDSHGSVDLLVINGLGVNGRDIIGGDGVDLPGTPDGSENAYLGAGVGTYPGEGLWNDTLFTIAAWVNADSWSGTFPCILSQINFDNSSISTTDRWLLYYDSGSLFWGYYTGGTFRSVSVAAPSTGALTMISCFYDQASGDYGISLNGGAYTTASISGNINTNGATTVIGAYKDAFEYPFNGGVARVGYWTKKLDSTDLTDLYNNGTGLRYADLGASPVFDPLSIPDAIAWLNTSEEIQDDAGVALTKTDGTVFRRVPDKVDSANTWYAPTLSASGRWKENRNGSPAFELRNGDYLDLVDGTDARILFPNANERTFFVVASIDGVDFRYALSTNRGTSNTGFEIIFDSRTQSRLGGIRSVTNFTNFINYDSQVNNTLDRLSTLAGTQQGGTSRNVMDAWHNGVLQSASPFVTTFNYVPATSYLTAGNGYLAGNATIFIKHILVYGRRLTAQEITDVNNHFVGLLNP
jgi:hypothetical protein